MSQLKLFPLTSEEMLEAIIKYMEEKEKKERNMCPPPGFICITDAKGIHHHIYGG